MDLDTLIAQRDELNNAINQKMAEERKEAIAKARAHVAKYGLTPEDVFTQVRESKPVPVKYRDAEGNTWSGRGQRPLWLRDALTNGATLEQFKIS